MNTPRLDSRLTLERPVRLPDGGGGWTLIWEAVGHIWGEIAASSGREAEVGSRPASRVSHRITIRRSAAPDARPTADQRLRFRDRVFAIRAVAEDGVRSPYLTIWAEEGPFS